MRFVSHQTDKPINLAIHPSPGDGVALKWTLARWGAEVKIKKCREKTDKFDWKPLLSHSNLHATTYRNYNLYVRGINSSPLPLFVRAKCPVPVPIAHDKSANREPYQGVLVVLTPCLYAQNVLFFFCSGAPSNFIPNQSRGAWPMCPGNRRACPGGWRACSSRSSGPRASGRGCPPPGIVQGPTVGNVRG